MPPSLLPVVLAADNFPSHPLHDPYPLSHPQSRDIYTPFHLTFSDYQARLPPVGLLRPSVLAELQADSRDGSSCPWQFHSLARPGMGKREDDEGDELDLEVVCVFFADWVVKGGKRVMGRAMKEVVERWRDEGKFPEPLGGWRDELYMVYAPSQSSALKTDPERPFSNAAFPLERAACAVFGFATFGVHLIAYEGEGSDMKVWVPSRSKTKATWPGRLDNSVAGGIPAGMTPLDAMVKECDEEASLPESLVRRRVKNVGVTTYMYITEEGYLQPEIEYTYDLPLPPTTDPSYVRPHPHDDEVESFALLSIPELIDALYTGDFKPNCGLILVDFLIRHALVTPETEPAYIEIAWRMRRRLGVGVPM